MKINSYKKELKEKRFRVSIFGSARIKKGDENYKQVYDLAKILGERGIDVVTGGGPGTMEAANSGHKNGSKITHSHSIGLSINLPKEQKTNKSVDIEKRFERFSSRLDNFMLLSNAVVVTPGGVGTLLELFYTWQLVQVKHRSNIPIILMGKQWKGLLKWLEKEPLKNKYFERKDLDLLFLAKNHKEVIQIIEQAYKEYKAGKKDFLSYKFLEKFKK